MKITGIKIRIVENAKSIVAGGSVMFNDVLCVDLRVLSGKNGLYVKLGSSSKSGDKWYDSAYITDKTFRELVHNQIITAYEDKLNQVVNTQEATA